MTTEQSQPAQKKGNRRSQKHARTERAFVGSKKENVPPSQPVPVSFGTGPLPMATTFSVVELKTASAIEIVC